MPGAEEEDRSAEALMRIRDDAIRASDAHTDGRPLQGSSIAEWREPFSTQRLRGLEIE